MVQSLPQADRLDLFQLCYNLLEKYPTSDTYLTYFSANIRLITVIFITVMQENDNHMLLGFIQASDGEKDPRILLVIFDMFQLLAKYAKFGKFIYIYHVTETCCIICCRKLKI